MDSSIELLEHRMRKGPRERVVSIASSDTPSRSLGKPIDKRYWTWQDLSMIIISLACLLFGMLAVANVAFAGYLGQKNQLIVIGLLLSLMAACTQKQSQLLLITLEARFGASTLQNYDSILRYSMIDANVNMPLKAATALSFLLPLGLSAAYKRFIGGTTALPLDATPLTFGPVGPPGLVGGILATMLNASLSLLVSNVTAYQSEPLFRASRNASNSGSFGFHAQIVSENTTALIDAPVEFELVHLRNTIKDDEVLEISTYVNATICSLNSTSESPERQDPKYWEMLTESLANASSLATYGTGLNFNVVTGKHNYSFALLSLWNESKGETFGSEAVGFNIYRGQCNATWQISPLGTTTLKDASNCTTAPQFLRPCLSETIPDDFDKDLDIQSAMQVPLTCNQVGVSSFAACSLYDLLWLQPVYPVWVAVVASMAWAELSYNNGPADWVSTKPLNESVWEATAFPLLKYPAQVRMTKTIQTLHRDHWALYIVLLIQPLLLLTCFFGRLSFFSTPVSSGFGLVTLLAGVSKDSLDVLRGAASSGKPQELRLHPSSSCLQQLRLLQLLQRYLNLRYHHSTLACTVPRPLLQNLPAP